MAKITRKVPIPAPGPEKTSTSADIWAVLKLIKALIISIFGQEKIDEWWDELEAKVQGTQTPWDDRILDALKKAWDRL